MAIALLVIAIGGFAMGHIGHLATLPEVASVTMVSAGSALIAVDWTIFAVTQVNSDTVEEQNVINPLPKPPRKSLRPPVELPKNIRVIEQETDSTITSNPTVDPNSSAQTRLPNPPSNFQLDLASKQDTQNMFLVAHKEFRNLLPIFIIALQKREQKKNPVKGEC